MRKLCNTIDITDAKQDSVLLIDLERLIIERCVSESLIGER